MFRSTLSIAAIALAITLPASTAAAQATAGTSDSASAGMSHKSHAKSHRVKHESKEDLQGMAKISMDSAQAIASAKMPGATVKSSELERYRGTVAYAFDMETSGKPGVEEVIVSARTGKVLRRYHESAKSEAREEKKEGKKSEGMGHDSTHAMGNMGMNHGDSVSATARTNAGIKAGGTGAAVRASASTKAKGKGPKP